MSVYVYVSNSTTLKASLVLQPLLGLTWLFGLFAINENTTVFAWLFTLSNSLQVMMYYNTLNIWLLMHIFSIK